MKNKLILLTIFAACIGITESQAQFNNAWQGKKCAVVLTYDDAIDQHLDNAVPVLDSLGLKATFYLTAFSPSIQKRLSDWKGLAAKGYELGNHTLFHPCTGGAGREWVKPAYDLSHYSVQRMVDETRMTNVFLQALDGQTERTFAFTCGDMKIGDSSFYASLQNDFVAARAVRAQMHKLNEIDLNNVDCYMVNGETGDQLIAWAKQAEASNSLLVILFHGVGGGNSLDVSLPAHRQFLEYLKNKEKDIWVAPMLEVAKYIKQSQSRDSARAAQQKATQDDYKNMLAQLRIGSTREGANGNDPKAPNAANYDETKANPFPKLPDALLFKNGKPVKKEKQWWERRKEIAEDFDREIYGRTPRNTPTVKWELIETRPDTVGGKMCTTNTLIGHVDNSSYPAINVDIQLQYTYRNDNEGKAPVILNFGFVRMPGTQPFLFPGGNNQPQGPDAQEQIIERGWVYATIAPNSVQADNGAGLTQGIIGLVNKGQYRKPDDWGALKAWAWGANEALNYFESTPQTDGKRVAIQGHSRYGKAALVTMAYYPRFATAFVSSSGEGGAKLHRRNAGELVENVASSGEYHWMAGNFIKYAGPLTWGDLPVDSHELIAMCAPRPVFISAGEKGDGWVDARGMFMAAAAAGPVYKLLGKKDLGTTEFPKVENGLMDGEISFRQHSAGHTPGPNWPYFLDFAARYFNK